MSSSAMMAAQQHQWSEEETREFIRIRADLEREPATRKKTLWETASARMRERGFCRTPDQCKCKWKNLLSRYKGKETSQAEYGWQCQFFDEIHAVFAERGKAMQRTLHEPGAGLATPKKRSLEDFSDLREDNEDESEEEMPTQSNPQKRKALKTTHPTKSSVSSTNPNCNEILEMLRSFFQWQQKMEMEWREVFERRYQERQAFEQDWRRSMENLERERLMAEKAWNEREEQRRKREDIRAVERDALLTALLNKLNRENNL